MTPQDGEIINPISRRSSVCFIILAKLIILRTMQKTAGKIPSATCELYGNRTIESNSE